MMRAEKMEAFRVYLDEKVPEFRREKDAMSYLKRLLPGRRNGLQTYGWTSFC